MNFENPERSLKTYESLFQEHPLGRHVFSRGNFDIGLLVIGAQPGGEAKFSVQCPGRGSALVRAASRTSL